MFSYDFSVILKKNLYNYVKLKCFFYNNLNFMDCDSDLVFAM